MKRTNTLASRKLAAVATLPFLALGLAACGEDEPIAPEEGETTETPPEDGSDDDTDTDGGTGTDGDTDTEGGDTETDGGDETDGGTDTDTDTEGEDGATGGGAGGDLSEFDNGEGAPGVFTANPGECLDSTVADEIINCDEEHDLEVFYTFNIEGDEFPGEEAIQEEITVCEEQFEAYVGAPASGSEYGLYALYPSQSTWDQAGDTEVICMLESTSPVTGSGYQSGS